MKLTRKKESTGSAPASGKGAPPKAKVRQSILGVFLVVILIGLSLSTFVIVAVGLIPTLATFIIQRGPQNVTTHVILAFNLSGVIPVIPVVAWLWHAGGTLPFAFQVLANPMSWAAMYGAAGIGALVMFIGPQFVSFTLERRAIAKIAALKDRQKRLVGEWGLDLITSALEDDGLEKKPAEARTLAPDEEEPGGRADSETPGEVQGNPPDQVSDENAPTEGAAHQAA